MFFIHPKFAISYFHNKIKRTEEWDKINLYIKHKASQQ